MDRTFETSHLSAVRAVPRTVFRFIFVKFFASGLKKRHVLVSMETLWLMATEKATREALLSEAGFEECFPDPELGRRSKLFCVLFEPG